MTISPLYW